jgi:hypothetical protein
MTTPKNVFLLQVMTLFGAETIETFVFTTMERAEEYQTRIIGEGQGYKYQHEYHCGIVTELKINPVARKRRRTTKVVG